MLTEKNNDTRRIINFMLRTAVNNCKVKKFPKLVKPSKLVEIAKKNKLLEIFKATAQTE